MRFPHVIVLTDVWHLPEGVGMCLEQLVTTMILPVLVTRTITSKLVILFTIDGLLTLS